MYFLFSPSCLFCIVLGSKLRLLMSFSWPVFPGLDQALFPHGFLGFWDSTPKRCKRKKKDMFGYLDFHISIHYNTSCYSIELQGLKYFSPIRNNFQINYGYETTYLPFTTLITSKRRLALGYSRQSWMTAIVNIDIFLRIGQRLAVLRNLQHIRTCVRTHWTI